jgi:16S rRNA processing protein RimM
VSRDLLPEPEDGEFYHADLIGLEAFGEDGVPLGTVTAVHNFGAGDMIEIAPAGGGDTMLVPFSDAAVPAIDLAARRMVVVPPVLSE